MFTNPSMRLATSKPVELFTVQPAGWPAQFDVMLLLKLKTPCDRVGVENLARSKRDAAAALDRVLPLDPGHVVENLVVVLVGDERLVAICPQIPDVLERHLRHRRRGLIDVDARQSDGQCGVGPVVDRKLMKNLIEVQPKRNSLRRFGRRVCVSLKARPCALMFPSPAPNVAPASPCGRLAGWIRCVFSKLYLTKKRFASSGSDRP